MFDAARKVYEKTLAEIREAGLFKEERIITTPQGPQIKSRVREGAPEREVLNFCANNYLGLSSHPEVIAAAKREIDERGFGLSSVRFICGTQDIHKELEHTISKFFGTDDTILYTSCFDANGGIFETLLGEEDAIISDALKKTQGKRLRMVATDGVFSMDGYLAKLDRICDLAEKYGAMVMVDDSHATGFIGKTGRGTPEHFGVMSRIDVMTGTLGKALGGGSGGYTTGKKEAIEMLRQRSRPYLFSNTLAPAIVGASLKVFELLGKTTELRDRSEANTKRFRAGVVKAGLPIKEGIHPIVPVMLGDAKLAQEFASAMLDEGIFVIGFFYPVVPKGEARIRVQISAAHTFEQIDRALAAFEKVGKNLGVVK